jgi:hypothetical protein
VVLPFVSVAGDAVCDSFRSFLASCIRAPNVPCTGTPWGGTHGFAWAYGVEIEPGLVEVGRRSWLPA